MKTGHECPRCHRWTLQQRLCIACLNAQLSRCETDTRLKDYWAKIDAEKEARESREVKFNPPSDNHHD